MEPTATNGAPPGAPENSIEFQLLSAYVQKRRPSRRIDTAVAQGYDAPQPAASKKRKEMRDPTGEAGAVIAVTDKLTKIVDSVPMDPDDIEPDGPDDVIDSIVALLRESGDRLNEEMKESESLAKLFRGNFSYSLFKKVTNAFLQKVDPADIPSSKDPEQAKVALTFEVTSRLTALDCHPMNVVMGYGVKYLQENYSGWVKQHGGWEKAFDAEDDEEVQ